MYCGVGAVSEDSDLMDELIQESREHLERIEPDLLELERLGVDASSEIINKIFRAMHSIKGGFDFFGKKNIVQLAHMMENVLARVRSGNRRVTEELVDALLEGTDTLRVLIDDTEHSDSIDISLHLNRFSSFERKVSSALYP